MAIGIGQLALEMYCQGGGTKDLKVSLRPDYAHCPVGSIRLRDMPFARRFDL